MAAERTRATPPQALGEAMEVPFMNCRLACVHWGTGAMAPPGALRVTPASPSGVGPLDDQLYCRPCTFQEKPQAPGGQTVMPHPQRGKTRDHAHNAGYAAHRTNNFLTGSQLCRPLHALCV